MDRFASFLNKSRKRRWLFGTVAALILLYAVLGFWIVPALAPGIIQKQASAALGTEVRVESVRMNPFLLSVGLRGLQVLDDQGEALLEIGDAEVDVQLVSVFRLAPVIKHIHLREPVVHVVRRDESSFNFDHILTHVAEQSAPEPEKEPGAPPRFYLGDTSLHAGRIHFADHHLDRSFNLDSINIQSQPLSNLEQWLDQQTSITLMALLNGLPTQVELSGQPFAAEPRVNVRLRVLDQDLTAANPYLPDGLPVHLQSARLTLDLNGHLQIQKQKTEGVLGGRIKLTNLDLREAGGLPLVSIPELTVKIDPSDLLVPRLHIRAVEVLKPVFHVRLPAPKDPVPASAETAADATTSQAQDPLEMLRDGTLARLVEDELAKLAPAELLLDQFNLRSGLLRVTDQRQTPPFVMTFRDLTIGAFRMGNGYEEPATFYLETGSEHIERLELEGELSLEPLAVQATASVGGVDVPGFAPYFREAIPTILEDARLDTKATLTLRTEPSPALTLSDASLRIRDLLLRNPETALVFAEWESLLIGEVRADALASSVDIGQILLEKPSLRANRLANGDLDLLLPLQKTADSAASEPPPTRAEESDTKGAAPAATLPVAVTLHQLGITDGEIHLSDQAVQPAFSMKMRDLTVTGTDLSTNPDLDGKLDVALLTDAGEAVHLNLDVRPIPLDVSGTLTVAGVPIRRYRSYYQDTSGAQVEAGTLDLEAAFSFAGMEDPKSGLDDATLTVRDLQLTGPAEAEDLLQVAMLQVAKTRFALAEREAVVGDVTMQGASLHVRRRADGLLNLAELSPPASSTPEAASPAAPVETQAAGKALQATLEHLAVRDTTIHWHDATVPTDVHIPIENIQVDLRGVSLDPAAGPARLDLALEVAAGTLELSGTVDIHKQAADLELAVNGVNGGVAQPYVAAFAAVAIPSLLTDVKGQVQVSAGEALNLGFQGDVAIRELDIRSAVDQQQLLQWTRLELNQLSAQLSPLSMTLADVRLIGPYAHVGMNEDGELNLTSVLRTPAKPAAQEKPATVKAEGKPDTDALVEQVARIQIESVAVEDGRFTFMDRSISPAFAADLSAFQGSIKGLSSLAGENADVSLEGLFFGQAPFHIKGQINPLSERLFVDLAITLETAGLNALSPYTGKHVGYKVEKGQLSLALDYKVQDMQLAARNHFLLDQFLFGDKVASEDAINVPVKLAVAVLKDRHGQIEVDIPIEGRLDDPEFKVWNAILQGLLKLTTKVAMSPFDALASALGTKEDLQEVQFQAGQSQLIEGAASKIDLLADALNKRPALRLDIQGQVDPGADRAAMREQRLATLLRNQKYKALELQGDAPHSPAEVQLAPGEEDALLRQLYAERGLPMPEAEEALPTEQAPTEQPTVEQVPIEQVRERLLASIDIVDGDLRQLAIDRANRVQNSLKEQVEVSRLFTVEPSVADDTAARVVFELK